MQLYFSSRPGCWERHLRRKHDNPLLFQNYQPITQQEVDRARRKDDNEQVLFKNAFHVLLTEVAALGSQVDINSILKLRDRIDGLYEQCASLGGNFNTEKEELLTLSEIIVQSISTSGLRDPQLMEKLKEATVAQKAHYALLSYSLMADLLHPRSPIIKEDIIPTLLTAEEPALRAAMSLFNAEQQKILCNEARNLLTSLKNRGKLLPQAWQRLTVMEEIFPLQGI